ncbi:MAG: glycosyltransferase [Verrucomicrobia bacterium]|nr:glycosyltransferase [Verrucomicrobiota bacterium]
MIRLLLIIDHLRGGGTEQQALVLARQWLAAGGAVDLLVFLPGGRLWSSIPDHPDCSVHILQYWLLATPTDAQGHKISRSRLELPNASLSRRMLEKVHLPLWAPGLRKTLVGLEPDIAVLMGRTANCYGKYIRECLETVPVIATVRTGKRLLPWHEETLRCADGIWTNCHWWAVRLQNLSIPAQRIRVIHNAVRAAIAQRPRDTDLVEVPVFINVAGFRVANARIYCCVHGHWCASNWVRMISCQS